jgi:thymidine phosphorylase
VKSNGVTAASVATIIKIVREKSDEAKQVAEKTGRDAWERARKQAGPVLDKMPDIKKVLDENASTLMSAGGGVALMSGGNSREIWDRIKQLADTKGNISEDKLNELKKFILEKVEAAKNGKGGLKEMADKFSGGGIENMVKMIPGGQQVSLFICGQRLEV